VGDRSFVFDYDGLFRQCADSVYRICKAILGDPDEAADAAQDVFKKLLTNPPKRHTDNVRGWLHSAARTTAIDHLRAMHRFTPLDESNDQTDPGPSPEASALDADLRRRLAAHLHVLTPDQRRVVELRSENVSAKEVALLLNRNVPWVNTTFFRALRQLRDAIGDEFLAEEGAR
jgi:RNA polymerase sigma-70 factor, ECF subfamily